MQCHHWKLIYENQCINRQVHHVSPSPFTVPLKNTTSDTVVYHHTSDKPLSFFIVPREYVRSMMNSNLNVVYVLCSRVPMFPCIYLTFTLYHSCHSPRGCVPFSTFTFFHTQPSPMFRFHFHPRPAIICGWCPG